MTAIDGPRLAPASGQAKALVVFLHGYGADGNDLIAIGREWQLLLPDAAFVAPHAPSLLPGSPMGRQWFPLTFRDPDERRRGVIAARPDLDAFLDAELVRTGVAPDRLALIGFSQGTMMALHVGLRRKVPPAAILGYSGMLVSPEVLKDEATGKPPILLIHGDRDEVIPIDALFAATDGLGAAEIPCEWHLSPGLGHGIDGEGLRQGAAFLASAFAPRKTFARMASQG
ncbi:phospholipase/carboxylesterase [Methylopila capsulata]|uniref:Phospholipase n=1 Tax=Methylopila capsulata TaxID=61654 RepID=A0A9W6IQY5_9HYPH|nr:dienelactone hydrolase family protein [Methylopila capsulata]MBM7851809.1 phospholipase/carboxylesterase [Methylopila capsulata]GLK54873.1 phospholipase [Methylopila capsulata]